MRWNIGFFGVKDLFTIINLLGGVGGIYFALRGHIEYAGYSIFAGYIFGDSIDGQVARLTKTSNQFGSEFDSAADGIGQGLAPAVIVAAAYRLAGYEYLGVALMALMCVTACIRQARFAVDTFNHPITYCGLPRTISGIVAISLPNATLFFHESFLGYEGGAVILALVALLNVSPVPYMTHKGRTLQRYVQVLVVMFFLVPATLFVFARDFVYDFLFVFSFGYSLGAWIPLTTDERRSYWAEYRRWSKQVASA